MLIQLTQTSDKRHVKKTVLARNRPIVPGSAVVSREWVSNLRVDAACYDEGLQTRIGNLNNGPARCGQNCHVMYPKFDALTITYGGRRRRVQRLQSKEETNHAKIGKSSCLLTGGWVLPLFSVLLPDQGDS